MNFWQYLKGKTVALVGPAGYLKGVGKDIDAHDVVVRVNHILPVLPPADYGSRTDVLYHGLPVSFRDRAEDVENVREEIEHIAAQVDWIVFRCPSEKFERTITKIAPLLKGANWTVIEQHHQRDINKRVKMVVNTGVIAVHHLLYSELECLSVYGFDFYLSGIFNGYPTERAKGQTSLEFNQQAHEAGPQIKYLASIKDKRFKPDKTLRGIIEQGDLI